MANTPITCLGEYIDNELYVKREDLIPFSFGGNKARKAQLFFQEIEKGDFDCVVTYGTGSSNHCRIIANCCSKHRLPCHIISPEGANEQSFNRQMMEIFGAEITEVPVKGVHDAIQQKLSELRESGRKPYFIEGGGHGNLGTEAYVQCYREIAEHERESNKHFDYIFHASGTGTTQAGLVCGQLMAGDERKIVGISIARKNPRGRDIVLDSIRSYLGEKLGEKVESARLQSAAIFIDEYTSGYGRYDQRVQDTIAHVLKDYGIPMDEFYTGKAFMGMSEYLKKEQIKGKKILFIHTGGTPLFFDSLRKQSKSK